MCRDAAPKADICASSSEKRKPDDREAGHCGLSDHSTKLVWQSLQSFADKNLNRILPSAEPAVSRGK